MGVSFGLLAPAFARLFGGCWRSIWFHGLCCDFGLHARGWYYVGINGLLTPAFARLFGRRWLTGHNLRANRCLSQSGYGQWRTRIVFALGLVQPFPPGCCTPTHLSLVTRYWPCVARPISNFGAEILGWAPGGGTQPRLCRPLRFFDAQQRVLIVNIPFLGNRVLRGGYRFQRQREHALHDKRFARFHGGG